MSICLKLKITTPERRQYLLGQSPNCVSRCTYQGVRNTRFREILRMYETDGPDFASPYTLIFTNERSLVHFMTTIT